ncbi:MULTISPECIES: ABC transporter substrate-binding protein [unclassified Modicisalibacter]|uniref:ABC transporter substrate-binding protein n=1 Tax=unclassified Modicisalibacter TaxID=2679913 RepID=UPI001CCA7D51|nr:MULTISPECIES: ABC transporter substrate-binding protein [unclassified Modicisalibacter]MBZ9558616.1 ABC transporter substrate-binding protein [Modicisalibacter sp. R2A 31.J]MBZ9575492.1 ABC transporter substrate-binding protein [Modicisalibacter sp. MOD 31.J]
MRFVPIILAWLLLGLCSSSFAADASGAWPRRVTDLAGREVRLEAPPQRIFLAQPRQLYSLLTLLDAPAERLAGWAYPLSVFDTAMAARLVRRWPALEALPALSRTSTPELDAEALLALSPDLVIFDLSRRSRIEGSALADVLDGVGIPYLYTEFNRHPLRDTPQSLRLLGEALGVESRAEAVDRLIERHLARIDRRLTGIEHRPEVLISIAPGLKVDCCRTNLDGGLADLVERAGGRNLAAELAPVSGATLSQEWVLAHPPEVILNTAGQWAAGDGIRVGIGVSADEIADDLRHLSETLPGWTQLTAVRQGRCYALWHGFHQGPFGIVALERIAKWLHPRRFQDLDPDATFTALLDEAGLTRGDGRFWGRLPAAASLSTPPTTPR